MRNGKPNQPRVVQGLSLHVNAKELTDFGDHSVVEANVG